MTEYYACVRALQEPYVDEDGDVNNRMMAHIPSLRIGSTLEAVHRDINRLWIVMRDWDSNNVLVTEIDPERAAALADALIHWVTGASPVRCLRCDGPSVEKRERNL